MTSRIAHLSLIGGASGDMLLGALVDVGLELDLLRGELAKLGVGGYAVRAERVRRGVIPATLVHVDLDAEGRRTRGIDEFRRVVSDSALPDADKRLAIRVFSALGDAEAVVHGEPGDHDETHAHPHHDPADGGELHELATVDTLVDVVGVVAGLRLLGVERVSSSPFPAGSGLVNTAHGPLPSPAPATMQIYAAAKAPVRVSDPGGPRGEAVTPTGAALITTLADFGATDIAVDSVGYGAGVRDPEACPNVLAIWLGQSSGTPRGAGLSLLETNVDDVTGEVLGYVQERLFEAGARDVWITPVQMKKSRPGSMLSALVDSAGADACARLILRETSTLGVRVRPVERYEAEREVVDVDTSLGRVPVKVKRLDGRPVQAAPEYEACRSVALRTGMTLREVMRRVRAEAEALLLDTDG